MTICVMIVDDSEADRFILATILNKTDLNVEYVEASNGQEALSYLLESKAPPDVIFLDLNMPIMNGFEFLEEVTTNHRIDSKVVVISSSYREDDIKRSTGFSIVKDYIAKPIDVHLIKDTVHTLGAA